jgi:anti-anti-sigma factor
MAFTSSLKLTSSLAIITLEGELDAAAAPAFRADVEAAEDRGTRRLVLMLGDLTYMSSAGLRALVFAKQKMGPNVDIYVIGAQPAVEEVLTLSGFHDSVILLPTYDPAIVEAA